jgi:hypothetical protein
VIEHAFVDLQAKWMSRVARVGDEYGVQRSAARKVAHGYIALWNLIQVTDQGKAAEHSIDAIPGIRCGGEHGTGSTLRASGLK